MPVHTVTTPSLADGLTVPTVGVNAFATGAPLIDKVKPTQVHLYTVHSSVGAFFVVDNFIN